jgi:hypothetical protein
MTQEVSNIASDFNRPLPDWVPKLIKERIADQNTHEKWIEIIGKEVKNGLHIEKHLSVKQEVANIFYSQMALEIVEAADELHLPFPSAGVSPSWSLYKSGPKETKHNAKVSPDEYILKFSPAWIINTLELPPYAQWLEIKRLVRHESFHLWEILHEPEMQANTEKQLEFIREKRPEIYSEVKRELTGKEIRAKKFELAGIKKEDTKTIRQFLIKSLTLVLMRMEISRRGKRRKQLGIDF